VPLWLQVGYTLFLAVLVPAYARYYGPANFLWLSDVALFLVGAALWLESGLLASMAAMVLPLEVAWNVDYFVRLATGKRVFGLSRYMFRRKWPLWLRALSLFHVPLPVFLVWAVDRLGYDARAFPAQTVLTWVVLAITRAVVKPPRNTNWVHGLGPARRRHGMAPGLYLALLMIALPLCVFLPTHVLLDRLFGA
jgi:hypothetical protein